VYYQHEAVMTHLGGRGVALLANPAVARLLGGLLQRRVQAPEVVAEETLVTPGAVMCHQNKNANMFDNV